MNAFFGQPLTAGEPWPRRDLAAYTRTIDYDKRASIEDLTFKEAADAYGPRPADAPLPATPPPNAVRLFDDMQRLKLDVATIRRFTAAVRCRSRNSGSSSAKRDPVRAHSDRIAIIDTTSPLRLPKKASGRGCFAPWHTCTMLWRCQSLSKGTPRCM